MALRLGDIAPDFSAETTHGNINFQTGLVILGASSFPILRITLQFVQLN